jgi:RimJ/RimL family protein N-acetyltransferase
MHIDTSKLSGQLLYLELLEPTHIETIRILAKNEQIWEFTKGLLINDSFNQQFDAYIKTAMDNQALSGQQAFVIRQRSDDSIIGMTRFYEIEPKDRRLAIGYTWYIPPVWGTRYNKECKLLLLQYVFETLGFNRVEFHVAHQNIRSQKAIEKIGGVKEGVLRKHGYRNDGSFRDKIIYGILSEEWPGKKEKLLQMIA